AYAASYQRVIAADTSLARSNGESNGENRVHSNRNRRQFLDGAGRYHHVGRLQLRELFGDGRSDSCVFATAKDVRRLEPLAVNRVDPVMCRVCRVLQHGYWPCDLADAAGSGMVQLRARRLDMFTDGLQDWIGLSETNLFDGRHKP